MIQVSREFHFDSAHYIKDYSGKCEGLHGHTYKLIVTVSGPLNEAGIVIDFAFLKQIVEDKIISYLDHRNLNEIFEVPTTERIAIWIFNQLQAAFKEVGCELYEVVLFEGLNNRVIVR